MKSTRTLALSRIALLMAVTIILAMTPLGYIAFPAIGVTLTFMVLPVVLGGTTLGMTAGIILGLTFGITSFIKAPTDALGQLLLSQNIILTILICIVPRLLVGVAAGLFGKLLRKRCTVFTCALAGIITSLTNTVLFLGMLFMFSSSLITDTFGVIVWSTSLIGGIGEAVIAGILCALIIKPVRKIVNQ